MGKKYKQAVHKKRNTNGQKKKRKQTFLRNAN